MEYKPVQKKNSSWTPTTVQKKGKSPGKLGHFSIQPKLHHTSAPSQEIGEYSRDSADRLTANVMRGLQAKEQEQAESSTGKRKSESPWAPGFDAASPITQTPASQIRAAFTPVSENPIQRQCADSSASVQRQLDTNHPHHPHQIWQRAQFIKPVVQKQIDPRVQMRQMIQRADQMAKNQASFDLESRLNASKDGSSPLAPEVIRFMEPRFGADFRGVRVHTGGEAMQMNQELGEYGESLLTPQERSRVQELLSGMNGINRNAALFIAGAFYQWLRNNGELGRWVLEAVSLGTSSVSEDLEAVEESLPKSGPFEMGRTAGDLAGIVTGVLEMIAGGGAVAGGGSLCLTGIGCIAGAPATVVGGATAVHGGSVVIEGTGNIAEDFAGLVSQVFAISGGGEENGGDTNDINWEWKSKPTFGHTFNRHGAGKKKTQRLRGRAATESQPQGQWLNNEEAAEFLRSIYPDISEATIVNIPEGLGQIIMPDGSIIPASRAWVIPRRGGVYTTAYPTLDTL